MSPWSKGRTTTFQVVGAASMLAGLILLLPTVNATLPSQTLRDSSANAFNLIEDPDGFQASTSTFSKYGAGITTGTFNNAVYSEVGYNLVGDVSITSAFRLTDPPAGASETFEIANLGGNGVGGEANNINLRLFIRGGAATPPVLRYEHQNGANLFTGNQAEGTTTLTVGDHTVTLRRTVSTNLVVVKLDGVQEISFTYLADTTGGTQDGRFVATTSGPNSGTVFETRIWDSLVSQTVLDSIASPNNAAFAQTAEGTEHGLYFFEHVCSYEGVTQTTNSIAGPVLALGVFGGIIFAVVGAFAFVLRGKAGASWILIGLLLSTIPFNPGAVAQVQPCDITTNQSADALGNFLISLMFALGILALPLIAITAVRRGRG